jgi:hypothetical protein
MDRASQAGERGTGAIGLQRWPQVTSGPPAALATQFGAVLSGIDVGAACTVEVAWRGLCMLFRVLMTAALAVILASCATPYQQSGLTGGADVRELRPDVYRVTFQGNGYTTRETVQVYWLNRCAELAVEKGFAGFEILSDVRFVRRQPPEDRMGPRLASTIPSLKTRIPVSWNEAAAFSLRPDGADLTSQPLAPVRLARRGTLFVYSSPVAAGPKPGIEADVHFLSAPIDAAPPRIFNARTLLAQLEPIIKAEKCGVGNVCPHVHDYLLPKDMLRPQQGLRGAPPSVR